MGKLQADQLAGVLHRHNRIFTGVENLITSIDYISGHSNWGAYTNHNYIRISASRGAFRTDRISDSDLIILNGLNYHECGHVMYSPHNPKPDVQTAYNILEDQRLEMLMSKLWPATELYLHAVCGELILNAVQVGSAIRSVSTDPQRARLLPLLIWGRKFIDKQIRDDAWKMYREESLKAGGVYTEGNIDWRIEELKGAIDRYLLRKHTRSNYPPDLFRCKEIRMIQNEINLITNNGPVRLQCSHNNIMNGKGEDVPTPNLDASDIEEAKAQGQEKGEEDPDTQEASGAGVADGDDKKEESKDQSVAPTGKNFGDMQEEIRRDYTKRLQDEDLMKDIQQQLDIQRGDMVSELPVGSTPNSGNGREPLGKERDMARLIQEHIDTLTEEAAPGYNRYQSTGKFNVQRAMQPDSDYETVFDAWDEGQTEISDADIVLLLDKSGSMGQRVSKVVSGAWALQTACRESIGSIKCHTILYSEYYEVLYSSENAWDGLVPSVLSFGGTNPTEALGAIRSYLSASTKKHKAIIVMTDGEWTSDAVAALNNMDNVYMYVLGASTDKFKVDHIHHSNGIEEFPTFIEECVRRIIRRED